MDNLNDWNNDYRDPDSYEELEAKINQLVAKINEIVTWINNQ